MERADKYASSMKKCIAKYRQTAKKEDEEAIVGHFKEEG